MKQFDINNITYKDLEGNKHSLPLVKKDFANALYNNANSIEMDTFAKSIHSKGKAELNEVVVEELRQVLPQLYKYRAWKAIMDYVDGLMTGDGEKGGKE